MDLQDATRPARRPDGHGNGMALVGRLDELTELVEATGPLYVRFSAGPDADSHGTSRDGESGALLPGLSVNRLEPEPWWHLPVRVWVARQLAQYAHLGADEHRVAWVLTGREVGRGPDSEPLVSDVVPVAILADPVLDEAITVYRESLSPGRVPDGR